MSEREHRVIIPGPPGTGKTRRLLSYLDDELNVFKTKPDRIAFIAYSRAAVRTIRNRITNPDVIVKTMHALGSEAQGLDPKANLLQGKKWRTFQNFYPGAREVFFEAYTDELGSVRYKHNHMKIIEYARNTKMKIDEAAYKLELHYNTNTYQTRDLFAHLNEFKRGTGMFEYVDMIDGFVKKENIIGPPLDAIFLDEAQDLSPLQWDMFKKLESYALRSYVAGDDDQTIYSFQGADPRIFINLEGKMDPQIKSQRVPRAVHKVAQSILNQMSRRMPKNWEPRDAEGYVSMYEKKFADLDFTKGKWFILARTNKLLDPIKDRIQNMGLRFDTRTQDLLPKDHVIAYRTWIKLNRGEYVDIEDVKKMWDRLRVKDVHIERGYSSGKTLDKIEEGQINIEGLRAEHGLRATGSWETLNFSEEAKVYIRTILKSDDDLMDDARIKISTIHGVKGEECENVILFTDLESIIYKSAQENPDTEHRVFFVGVTRTKENLYVMTQDEGETDYLIGGAIV